MNLNVLVYIQDFGIQVRKGGEIIHCFSLTVK